MSFIIYVAAVVIVIAIAATGTSAWFVVPLAFGVGALFATDLRKWGEHRTAGDR